MTDDTEKETRPIAESDAVFENEDGELELKMESLQKGGGDPDERLGRTDRTD
ncbi:hypothetical protein RYH80_09900 [Halobaculum sp. MBLA0147]|uniref:hypothetical protein n=1 Tax=Halobaculum sp. MBLA0147 TaxID=3079934 RepID=UPI0035242A9A